MPFATPCVGSGRRVESAGLRSTPASMLRAGAHSSLARRVRMARQPPMPAALVAAAVATACARGADSFEAAGDAYFAKGQYREAVLEYRNAVTKDGHRVAAFRQMGEAYYKLGRGPQAL